MEKETIKFARKKHGSNFHYETKKGKSVDLTKLMDNQQVCKATIKGHYILMTKK